MKTTVKLPYTRFVRRANSGVITNTQWLGAMDSTFEALKTAPWIETAEQAARHTVNDPTSLDFSGAEYDAFRQSGAAIAETGEQVCFTGIAVYRIAVPSTASSTHITGISFRASSDVSIHAPAGGATHRRRRGFVIRDVSIHAPAGGATR